MPNSMSSSVCARLLQARSNPAHGNQFHRLGRGSIAASGSPHSQAARRPHIERTGSAAINYSVRYALDRHRGFGRVAILIAAPVFSQLDAAHKLLNSCLICGPPEPKLARGGPALEEFSQFSSTQTLRDGRQVEIRAQRPEDRVALEAAVARLSSASLYRRFFGVRREFSEKEAAHFLHIDFVDHVALVVVASEDDIENIIGGGRYVVVKPGQAEVAFAIVDAYQGQGIGGALMLHLATIARAAGLKELVAEVLAENATMLKVFKKSRLPMRTRLEHGVVHVALDLSQSR